MRRSWELALLAALCLAPPALAALRVADARARATLLLAAAVSALGFLATRWLVPQVAAKTLARGICGKDLNKRGTPAGDVPVPEAAGLAPGLVFLLCVVAIQQLHFHDAGAALARWGAPLFGGGAAAAAAVGPLAAGQRQPLPDSWLVDYNAALATIGFMLLLGFVDDVLDVRWRVKLLLPAFASLPLLVAYSGAARCAARAARARALPCLQGALRAFFYLSICRLLRRRGMAAARGRR